jgi:hypothetical protein
MAEKPDKTQKDTTPAAVATTPVAVATDGDPIAALRAEFTAALTAVKKENAAALQKANDAVDQARSEVLEAQEQIEELQDQVKTAGSAGTAAPVGDSEGGVMGLLRTIADKLTVNPAEKEALEHAKARKARDERKEAIRAATVKEANGKIAVYRCPRGAYRQGEMVAPGGLIRLPIDELPGSSFEAVEKRQVEPELVPKTSDALVIQMPPATSPDVGLGAQLRPSDQSPIS